MQFSNFHTHTLFCDGNDSVEEIVKQAISLGCPELGFSGHSTMNFAPPSYSMTGPSTAQYQKAVQEAKKKYGARIGIFLGVEQEYFSEKEDFSYDYVIGSVHYIKKDGEYLPVDESAALLRQAVNKNFNGDPIALAKEYYRLVAALPDRTRCDILGHFDLVTKFNQTDPLLDENGKEYRKAALDALEQIGAKRVVLELNTGAMSRGYRSSPYPAPFLLDAVGFLKLPVVFSSDAHSKENLLFGFETVSELAKKYKLTVLTSMEEILSFTGN